MNKQKVINSLLGLGIFMVTLFAYLAFPYIKIFSILFFSLDDFNILYYDEYCLQRIKLREIFKHLKHS